MSWQRIEKIGDCTLYLGDCLKVMPCLSPACHVITDPPYEDDMHESKCGARGLRTDGGKPLEALNFSSISDIRVPSAYEMCRLSNGWMLAFCTPEGVAAWRDEIEKNKARYKRACVWVKPDAAPQFNGQGPAMGAENFVAAWCGKGHSRWNGGGKRGVYTHCVNAPDRCKIVRVNKDSGKPEWVNAHPTEKPLRLMRELVTDFTAAGQTVLDPFMGIGSTGVACVLEGRSFTGIELNPEYFDIACERIAKAVAQPKQITFEVKAGPRALQSAFQLPEETA